jgi:hypothetical protein
MLERLRETNLNSTKRVDIPEDEKSQYWRTALRLYSIALPFYLMCLVLFYFPPMMKDIACEL